MTTSCPRARSPALRVMPMPADANQNGDIFGGWIMAQVDIAGGTVAGRLARGRVATVAVKEFVFKQPVQIGDVLSFYVDVVRVGNTSITVKVEVYAERRPRRPEGRQGDRGDAHLRRHRPRRAAAPGAAQLACCSTRPRWRRSPLLGLGAAVIGGIGGFGTGIILTAALAPLIGVKAVMPVLAVAGVIINAGRFWFYRDEPRPAHVRHGARERAAVPRARHLDLQRARRARAGHGARRGGHRLDAAAPLAASERDDRHRASRASRWAAGCSAWRAASPPAPA